MSKTKNAANGLLAKIYGQARYHLIKGFASRSHRRRAQGWVYPHQGGQECARRRAQMAAGRIPRDQCMVGADAGNDVRRTR